MTTSMHDTFNRIKKFIQASLVAFPDDIERPFHKKANLTLKTISITILLIAILLIVQAAGKYGELQRLYQSELATYANNGFVDRQVLVVQKEMLISEIIFKFFLGFALILIESGMGSVLLLRYMAFTLPDKIYLRCFSTPEEKEKKKRFK